MENLSERYTNVVIERTNYYLNIAEHVHQGRFDKWGSKLPVAMCEVFESFLIYQAARDLNFYEMQELELPFEEFFNSLLGDQAGPAYVSHSERSQELRRNFPEFSPRLEILMTAGRVGKPALALRAPELLEREFSKILLLQLGMLEQPSISVFSAAMRYVSDENWTRLMEHRPSPREVAMAGEENDLTTAAIYHGFLSVLGKVAAINDSISQAMSSGSSVDAGLFSEYIRNTINWRIDIRNYRFNKRFDLLRKRVLDETSLDLPIADRKRFKEHLEEILDEVLGFVAA
jgi:hypothetical protein